MMKSFYLLCLSLIFSLYLYAQPEALDESISIRLVASGANNAVRIDHHPQTGELYYATIGGDIYKVNIQSGSKTKVYGASDHGLSDVYGFEIGATGTFYLVNAEPGNHATIKRSSGDSWVTMATTSYPSASGRDHQFNAVIETQDGQHILVNSGSRTDHGDANNDGSRELPITSKIIKLPVNVSNITLPDDDLAFLETNGYIYASGVRNTFDLEYAPNGDLFGVENSDTRDNEEELNWLQEGYHYGFPWRIGTHENPQQFPDYDPDADPLLVAGINKESIFKNDPDFPDPPAGVTLTGPVLNHGPDSDSFRDTVDGVIKDGSDVGRILGTFTPHSSPVALTFDVDSAMDGMFRGRGFAMSYNAASRSKYAPFNEPGEDLLMLDLTKAGDNYEADIHRIAQGFEGPVDATIIENKMYVVENGGGRIWELTFPEYDGGGTVSGLSENKSGLASLQVYPNGFNESANIKFSFDHAGSGQALIYSVTGQLLQTLWEGSYRPNEVLAFKWRGTTNSGSSLPSGVYFLKIESDQGSFQHRIIKR